MLLLRGVAKGEPTARLSRELGLCRKQAHTLRHRVQENLYETLPTDPLAEPVFEADELYQNAGGKGRPHTDPADPPRRRANKRKGHGTYETDRPPVLSVACRSTGEVRLFVREHSDADTCLSVVTSTVPAGAPAGASTLYTDEWAGYGRVSGRGIGHSTVKHGRAGPGRREWARDADGDGIREVHCNTCEGAGAGLRTFPRAFRGVHKFYLAEYLACYETMANAKRITAEVVQRMCLLQGPQLNYT